MTSSINQNGSRSRRVGLLALGIASALSLGLLGPGVAAAQAPAPTAPTAPTPTTPAPTGAVPANLSVEIDDDDSRAREGEDYRYEVTVTNDGSTVASGVGVRISLPEEFEVEEETNEERLDRSHDGLDYALGDLAPGRSVELHVHGEFEDIGRDEDDDRLEATAEVWNDSTGSDDDSFEVRVSDDRDNR